MFCLPTAQHALSLTHLDSEYPQLYDALVVLLLTALRRQLQSANQIHLPTLLHLPILTATTTTQSATMLTDCLGNHTL